MGFEGRKERGNVGGRTDDGDNLRAVKKHNVFPLPSRERIKVRV
jgi:hypothetical protein